jgi:hypothetical protein
MNKYRSIFVKNDINNVPLYVGDKVRVTRKRMMWATFTPEDYEVDIDIPEQAWEGEIVLLLSKGISVRCGKEYIHPNLTNNGYRKWIWEKL